MYRPPAFAIDDRAFGINDSDLIIAVLAVIGGGPDFEGVFSD